LDADEATHAHRVLRLGNGDEVEVLDGAGRAVVAKLRFVDKKCFLDFVKELPEQSERAVCPLVLRIGVLKGEAMDWLIEKAVELGVAKVAPFISDHTVVQLGRKTPEEFQERWQRIADQALKQCGRRQRLEVFAPTSFARATESEGKLLKDAAGFFADELDAGKDDTLGKCLRERGPQGVELWIGPEGGWSAMERELLYRFATPVSLGALILRAETAAISSAAIVAENFRAR
jgi:16S rRNA (uracil1498-N3)-methyltransferase